LWLTRCGPGKNSADFGISFQASQLHLLLPTTVPFAIVSNDNDHSHTVKHLLNSSRAVALITSETHMTTVPQIVTLLSEMRDGTRCSNNNNNSNNYPNTPSSCSKYNIPNNSKHNTTQWQSSKVNEPYRYALPTEDRTYTSVNDPVELDGAEEEGADIWEEVPFTPLDEAGNSAAKDIYDAPQSNTWNNNHNNFNDGASVSNKTVIGNTSSSIKPTNYQYFSTQQDNTLDLNLSLE
jgi:hypothetical protein